MQNKTEQIGAVLSRNVEDAINREHLKHALMSGKKLRVKLGIDPTGDKLHIGHAIAFWKLKQFQDLGHKIILIIGDFTAQIGDPSDKLQKRPFLSRVQVKKNLKSYLGQIGKIVDLKKAEVRYNSEWLAKLNFREISELAENFTFQQILERRNFKERLEKGVEISLREGMYPLMQGYDSVAIRADVELGGSDQLFNLLAGRKIQERYKQKPQDILTTKMLIGLDGRKMSKSWGNVINIADSADDQFGKVMSMQDEHILDYFGLATDLTFEEVRDIENDLKKGTNPKIVKEKLAYEIAKRYHGAKAAEDAKERFEKIFSRRETPSDLPALRVSAKNTVSITDLVLMSGRTKSKSEARRLIEQGGVHINNEARKNPGDQYGPKTGDILKIGKKDFWKINSK